MKRIMVLLVLLLSVPSFSAIHATATSGSSVGGVLIMGNGSSGCIHCLPQPTSYSFVFWIKADSNPTSSFTSRAFFFSAEASLTSVVSFFWDESFNSAYEDTCTKSTDNPISNISPVTGGVWYHVACTWDGTNQRSYKNGTLIQTTASSASVTAGNNLVQVLGDFPDANYFFTGSMAEVAYYQNVVLTANEIAAMAAGTTPMTINKPTVYMTMWGTSLSTNFEADLSGSLTTANPDFNGVYYNCTNGAGCSAGTSHVAIANHAPVRPFSTEEESQGQQ